MKSKHLGDSEHLLIEEKNKLQEKVKVETSTPSGDENQEKINSDEPFISESEGEQKNVTIFASESEGDNMHGGNDPDNLASSNPEVKSFLTKIGVTPGQPVEGTVAFMIEGKKDLELSNIALTDSQVTEVADFISTGDSVKSVCLRNAGIDDEKFVPIADSLIATKSKPLMLNFNLNQMTSGSVEKMIEVLLDKPSIEILLLHGNPLGDEGVKILVNGILDIHQAFRQKKAEEQEVDKEVARETTRCVLKELDLGDTDMGDEGIGHVAYLLEKDSDLKTLNLNGNTKVGYTGWKRLSKALKRNKTLRSLTLDFNKIGDEGIAALVSGLKVNTSLQTLDLESTGLSEEGGKMLVDLVKCNTTILEITILPGNKISNKTQEEIRNYLGMNKAVSSKMSTSK